MTARILIVDDIISYIGKDVAVFGVGMARGLKALNLQTLKEIVASWIVTIPLCALLSVIMFYFLKWLII